MKIGIAGIGRMGAAIADHLLTMGHKDLRVMQGEAHALGRALPVCTKALECHDEASLNGLSAADAVMLPASFIARHPPLRRWPAGAI